MIAAGSIGLAFARSTGCPSRATFRIDMSRNYTARAPHAMAETFRFCPNCGGPLASRSLKSGDPDRLVCDRCGFVFYLDPKVAVGTIIDDGDRADRAGEAGHRARLRQVGVPGRLRRSRRAACGRRPLREAREECGLDVRLDGLVDLYSYAGRTPIIIVYAAALVGGDAAGGRRRPRGALVHRRATCRGANWRSGAPTKRIRDYFDGRRHALRSSAMRITTDGVKRHGARRD